MGGANRLRQPQDNVAVALARARRARRTTSGASQMSRSPSSVGSRSKLTVPSGNLALTASKAAAVTAMRIVRRRYFVGRRGLA